MEVSEAIDARRAYRSLVPFTVTDELIKELASAAQLAPSCYNNQPWRFIFVREDEILEKLKLSLSPGNAWANSASLIVAVYSQRDVDCIIDEREYYLFDTGIATAFLLLRATELGLVAHPIAGYDSDLVKEKLGISAHETLITLLIISKRTETVNPILSSHQVASELDRPARLALEKISMTK